ncbi:thioredoxin [Phaeocystidibacter marisrubri]|uniref:Thioredoxin n=1 Tax=Phaeocystidibacter marisrubri TaxID=1577780 RepID=A0A6L3ZIA5_9FLAO|nr:thioredoxin [Phaeocystidibacter marisrubri]KAB2816910.1 thioredoxin [Phaeocystidibacter marisrubri]GGH77633.1 thioredoxin [Phaeocystidibacter marisrubri]
MSTFGEIIGTGNVLVDFHATWCQPCKMLGPILQELAGEWGDQVKVIKIDVDRNPELAQKLDVRGVPTMVLYVNGKSVWRKSGVLPKHQIKAEIEHAIRS